MWLICPKGFNLDRSHARARAHGREEPRNYVIAAVLFGHVWKNVGYTLYDWYLYGALAFFDLWTLSVKSVFEIVLTFAVLAAVRRSIGRNYLA